MTQQQSFIGMEPTDNRAKLEQKFIVPPFSVLDTRQGYWQERKRLWLSLGIKSEIGRGEDLTYQGEEITSDNLNYYRNKGKPKQVKVDGLTFKSTGFMAEILTERGGGTSIFDPVLCELIYKWFCPKYGTILDPFAGGSARGIVASILGYDYTGIDLSEVQLDANRQQAQEITPSKQPQWIVGDSCRMDSLLPQGKHYDLIFTCPPYHDLEQYTDDMDDLSNMSWGTFKQKYNEIIAKSILKLKPNRFTCFVVSEIRDEVGGYKGLVPHTIDCFTRNGMRYYNEIVLVNVIGSLPVRIDGQFGSFRKIGRTHQNILVFYKGDVELIPKYFKDIDSNIASIQQQETIENSRDSEENEA